MLHKWTGMDRDVKRARIFHSVVVKKEKFHKNITGRSSVLL